MAKGAIVLTTTEKVEDAERICDALLKKKLCACAQIVGPIRSRYWWNNKIENANEFLCLFKTTCEKYAELEREIRANHPYSVPEIVCVEIKQGHQDYLHWLLSVVESE